LRRERATLTLSGLRSRTGARLSREAVPARRREMKIIYWIQNLLSSITSIGSSAKNIRKP
jgi:hypothetical protein